MVVGGCKSHFQVKPNLVLRLGWGFDNKGECILSIVVVLCDPYYDIITVQQPCGKDYLLDL